MCQFCVLRGNGSRGSAFREAPLRREIPEANAARTGALAYAVASSRERTAAALGERPRDGESQPVARRAERAQPGAAEKRVAATRAQARAYSLRGTHRVAELFLLCPFCANMLITAGTVGR